MCYYIYQSSSTVRENFSHYASIKINYCRLHSVTAWRGLRHQRLLSIQYPSTNQHENSVYNIHRDEISLEKKRIDQCNMTSRRIKM
jgi:hypothetical protein